MNFKKGSVVAFTRYTSSGTAQLVEGKVIDTHDFCKAVKVQWVANAKRGIYKSEWMAADKVVDASGPPVK